SGVNPVYDLPEGEALATALAAVPLVVSFAERVDETARAATYVCPDRHFLETWGDTEPVAGIVAVSQPVVGPLGGTRSILESLAAWTRGTAGDAREIVRGHWLREIYPRRLADVAFDDFWNT